MQSTEAISVTLPAKIVERLRAKVAEGSFANEAEVIEQGLLALDELDAPLEKWMIEETVLAYDQMHADPSQGVGVDEVRAILAADHKQALKAE